MDTNRQTIHQAMQALNTVVLGKERHIQLALCAIFAGGHVLMEDLPGMGKTTMAQAIAKVLGLHYQRIQFTSDLLPSDVVGATIFDPSQQTFRFHKGPVFSQMVLADELNRATPKSQSALLEAMEEGQVTVDGQSQPLPQPFFVMATQNPQSQTGTFPLPESQLDRFLMRLSLGYPNPEAEQALLMGDQGRARLATLQPVLNTELLSFIQQEVVTLTTSPALIQYVHRLVQHTRQHEDVQLGLSPRGAIALVQAAKAWAYIEGRLQVLPEDVQSEFVPIASHRLIGRHEKQGDVLARQLLAQVPVVAGAS